RRHTRCYRDWSSDVCSSDLKKQKIIAEAHLQTHLEGGWRAVGVLPHGRIVVELDESTRNTVRRVIDPSDLGNFLTEGWKVATTRSEERRVGKECRDGWVEE